jgi:hypothetical protein
MGTTGKGASNYINAASLREVFHANIKVIFGFPGSAELRVAVERGELDGDCGGFSSIPAEWITDQKAHPFVRFARQLAQGVPANAVYVGDLAQTVEQKAFLKFLYSADELGRSFVISKRVPADRLGLLRRAFDRTMRDAAFRAEMDKVGEPVMPLTGEQAQRIFDEMKTAPAEIVARAKRIYE